MQSPTIAALKQARPNWHLTVWVAPRGTRELAKADPNVDAVIEMPIKTSLLQHARQINRLRHQHFDIGIVLSPGQLTKSAAYLLLSDIPKRVGAAYPLFENPHSSFLLTDAVEEQDGTHDVEQNLRLLKPLGLKELRITDYELQITPAHERDADKLLARLSIPTNRVLIGIHAGSAPDLPGKRWPPDRFAAVAAQLSTNHNAHFLLFGGPDEVAQRQELQKRIGPASASIVSAPLLTTAAALKKCHLLLSNDSGLMHIAAAISIPTFAIFGPTDETKTGPRGPKTHVIRAPGTIPMYDTERNFNIGQQPHPTMLAVTPAMVLDELRNYI